MPKVPVTGAIVTHNSPFYSLVVAVTIVSTHFAYPWSELAWVTWLNTTTEYLQSPISVLTRLNIE